MQHAVFPIRYSDDYFQSLFHPHSGVLLMFVSSPPSLLSMEQGSVADSDLQLVAKRQASADIAIVSLTSFKISVVSARSLARSLYHVLARSLNVVLAQ